VIALVGVQENTDSSARCCGLHVRGKNLSSDSLFSETQFLSILLVVYFMSTVMMGVMVPSIIV